MSELTKILKEGDIFLAFVTNKHNPDGNGYLLESTNKIICWGARGKLPVRYITRAESGRLAVVPANKTSIPTEEDYRRLTVECGRAECANSVYLPKRYESNPIFCSLECLKLSRRGKTAPDNTPTTATGQVDWGEHIRTDVTHFSSNGNAVIQHSDISYNAGPLCPEAVHEKLEFVHIRGLNFALCLNQEYWGKNYLDKMGSMLHGIQLPAVENIPEPVYSPEDNDQRQEDTESEADTSVQASETNAQKQRDIVKAETTKSDSTLKSLRRKAEKDAKEDVGDRSRSTKTEQYNRSSAVRDYVLARADGQCEACEEPAPFTSRTGDPYLHAHHIHELSDGGTDTPDNVIAICPNCHYQVHHGKNGSEYNEKLAKKLENMDN
jgi:5-methylcytosine-specific restriction endonuclease McrA